MRMGNGLKHLVIVMITATFHTKMANSKRSYYLAAHHHLANLLITSDYL